MTFQARWQDAVFLVGSCLAALACGMLIGRGEWIVPAALAALGGIVLVGLRGGPELLALLTVAALLQPPLGNIGGIPGMTLSEIVAPILCVTFMARLTHPSSSLRAIEEPERTTWELRVVQAAILAYAAVIGANFLRTKFLLPIVVPGVNRAFYDYFIALAVFALIYLALTTRGVTFRMLLRIIFSLSLALCLLGIAAVILRLPLNLGSLRYSVVDIASGGVRVGFLETFGTAGLAVVFAARLRFPLALAAGLLFAGAIVASGGRAAAVGVFAAITAYVLIARRGGVILAIVGVGLIIALFAPQALTTNVQAARLTDINSRAFYSAGRGLIYRESLHGFRDHALVGTGIGVPPRFNLSGYQAFNLNLRRFYAAQFAVGGHATYAALLKNFGLVGFLPFVVGLAAALWGLARLVRETAAAGFFFIFLFAQGVSIFAGGNGSDPVYFFALGGGAAVLSSRLRHRLPVDDDGKREVTG